MDSQALVQALSNTLFPDQREQAEALLEEVGSCTLININFILFRAHLSAAGI